MKRNSQAAGEPENGSSGHPPLPRPSPGDVSSPQGSALGRGGESAQAEERVSASRLPSNGETDQPLPFLSSLSQATQERQFQSRLAGLSPPLLIGMRNASRSFRGAVEKLYQVNC